jgi:uncharacterized membrane protein
MKSWRLVSAALTVAAVAASLYVYRFRDTCLPPLVPVHWNGQMQPDHFVARADVLPWLLITPGLMALFLLLTPLLRWLSPRHFEVERFATVYEYVMALVVMLLAYLHGIILWASIEGGSAPRAAFLAGLFLFFVLLGNVLGRVQRNFWIGVRTPWTLASDAVWIRTHRFTAWLFVAFGLGGFFATLAGVPVLWCLAGVGVIVLVPILYSLVLYKRLEREGRV